MKVRNLLIASLALAALMAAFAFYTASRVPPGTELPTHWGLNGEPDRMRPALQALMLPAGLLVLISGFFAIVPRLEPLQDRLQSSAPLLRAAWIGMIALMVLIQITAAGPVYGFDFGARPIVLAVGVLLLVIGNVLPKSRPGFFVGIRTPWTITDTDIWIATHRLGGKLMMLAGAAILVATLLPIGDAARVMVMVTCAAGAGLVPAVYSWWLWHRNKVDA